MNLLIADHHPITLHGFQSYFCDFPDISVKGCARNEREIFYEMERHSIDILLLSMDIPGINCFSLLDNLKKVYSNLKVVLTGTNGNSEFISDCILKGANSFFMKTSNIAVLSNVVKNVYKHGIFIEKQHHLIFAKALQNQSKTCHPSGLTEKELKVLLFICKGYLHKQIASELNLSVKTVDFHKGRIYKKTGCKSNADIVVFAIENNLYTR